MRAFFRDLRRDERGFSLVLVAIGFMAFFSAAALAVDVGLSMTARAQAQNAADAGALAGATALVFNNFTNRTASGPAVLSAINAGQANKVIGQSPSILAGDVTFPLDPTTGQPTRIKVSAYRIAARRNAVPTFIATLFGVNTMDIAANATAEASPANEETCVKPFMIPDRWNEKIDKNGKLDGPFDPLQNFTFDVVDNKGKFLANPDVYIPASQPGYTGYTAADFGTYIVLRAGTLTNPYPSSYFSWAMPGDTGGNDYRNNISGCNTTKIPLTLTPPWFMTQEPGNMVGPTDQGIDDLIAEDPNATFNLACKCVKNSAYGVSPRVTPLPLYDPYVNAMNNVSGKTAVFQLANVMGFFVDKRVGNDVYGYMMAIAGTYDGSLGPAPAGIIPKMIRLVQ